MLKQPLVLELVPTIRKTKLKAKDKTALNKEMGSHPGRCCVQAAHLLLGNSPAEQPKLLFGIYAVHAILVTLKSSIIFMNP